MSELINNREYKQEILKEVIREIHAAVFKGSIEEIHHPEEVPGHPIHTLKSENEALEKYIEENIR